MNELPKSELEISELSSKVAVIKQDSHTSAADFFATVSESQRRFLVIVGLFVIVVSFAYGLVTGLNKQVAEAVNMQHASDDFDFSEEAEPFLVENLDLIPGLTVRKMGSQQRINAQESEVLTMLTNFEAEVLLSLQVKLWKEKGYRSLGMTSKNRGVALAFDEQSDRRYSMIAWSVPPTLRHLVSEGKATQAIVSYMSGQTKSTANPEEQGEVPGVPLMPGGTSQAVFSASDYGVRSYNASYSNPGEIKDSIEFYRDTLLAAGWRESEAILKELGNSEVGYLMFAKQEQELTLMLAPVLNDDGSSSVGIGRTSVQVSLSMGSKFSQTR